MSIKAIFYEIINGTHLGGELSINEEECSVPPRTLWRGMHPSQAFHIHINCVATSKQPVLLWKYGDTEPTEVAELIHRRSPFAEYQLATVSCRANPFETWGKALAQLIDPHRSRTDKQPPYPTCMLPGGTLFLDDLEYLPKDLQCLLYAMLDQEGMIRFMGSNAQGVEVRVMASASTDIWKKSQEGLFQASLFCQLNRLAVHCPSNLTHSLLPN